MKRKEKKKKPTAGRSIREQQVKCKQNRQLKEQKKRRTPSIINLIKKKAHCLMLDHVQKHSRMKLVEPGDHDRNSFPANRGDTCTLELAELELILEECLARLSRAKRTALSFRARGLSYREMSLEFDCSPPTAMRLVKNALLDLKNFLITSGVNPEIWSSSEIRRLTPQWAPAEATA